ncbi:MAG: hypothetical protein KC462_08780 [Cyanobacteria bacterium HKST-UBA05]|nr:hypothetical protein [Cyanobacteria bacterium HKST-UBA05]
MAPTASALWPFNKNDDVEEVKAEDMTAAEKIKQEQGKLSDDDKKEANKRVKKEAAEEQQQAVEQQQAAAQAQQKKPKVHITSPISKEVDSLEVERPVQTDDYVDKNDYVAVDDPANPLGITTSARQLDSTADMIDRQQYSQAVDELTKLKQWLVDATEVHINLYKTLKEVSSAQVQAELEKQLALQFAVLRDKAFFQLGMAALGQKDYSTAIKNLSKVVQSQPRSPMGAKAYEVLQQIGFTEKVKLREATRASSSTSSGAGDSPQP